MSETQAILARIVALRQRLEQGRGLTQQAVVNTGALQQDWHAPAAVARQVEAGAEHDALLDRTVSPVVASEPACALPTQLTARARQVLEKARDLLGQLRALGDAFAPPGLVPTAAQPGAEPVFVLASTDPLARCYRDTVAIADTTLRMIPQLPATATGQLHLCAGVDGILAMVAGRLRTLAAAVARHRSEHDQVGKLADLLTALLSGQLKDLTAFTALAEAVHAEASEGGPLRFLSCAATCPPRFVAAHSLTVARVMARLLRHDPELRAQPVASIVAALVHDAGMLRVAAAVLAHPGPLDDGQRRLVEGHCRAGAALLLPLQGDMKGLAQAANSHHERLDGTGYPDGLRQPQLASLARLLAVCDCYVSLGSDRPHRPARETRTALADTLLLADHGQLDRQHAEHLLQLSFYPVGSAVELADGAIGVVVATPGGKLDLNAPARPVVALLLDGEGHPMPLPRYLDLAHSDHHSIVRTLSRAERLEVLGPDFPELATP